MEAGAGQQARFPDSEYAEKGVRLAGREEVFATADVILQVRSPGANTVTGASDLVRFRRGCVVIGFGESLTAVDAARALADRRRQLSGHGADAPACEILAMIQGPAFGS